MQIPSHIIAQKNLIKLKEAYGLSYTTISKQSGMDLRYIQRLFSGNRSLGFKNLDRFARFFSIASHELLNPNFNVICNKQIYINGKDKTVHRLTKE